jgi:hypothetical protein
MASEMIQADKLHELKFRAESTFHEANGEKVLAEFDERINKGMRYLASLRDRAKSEDIPESYVEAAKAKLADLQKERLLFKRKYLFPLKVYSTLYELASFTTDLGLPKNVAGERPVNALQIKVGPIELLIDLADNGIPF